MASIKQFKKYSKESRRVTEDGRFSKGVRFSNNILRNAEAKLLVNYEIKDGGGFITPRLGLDSVRDVKVLSIPNVLDAYAKVPGVHVAYYGVYRDNDGIDKFAHIKLSFGNPTSDVFRYYLTDKNQITPDYYKQVYRNSGSAFGYLSDESDHVEAMNVNLINETRLKFWKNTPKPLYTILDNKLYCINGLQSSSTTPKDVYVAGALAEESTTLEYTGAFISFIIKGHTENFVSVEPFTTTVFNASNQVISTYTNTKQLCSLPNGVADEHYVNAGIVYQRVKTNTFSDVNVLAVEDHTNVTLVYVTKPTDSVVHGNTSPYNLGATVLEGYGEVGIGTIVGLDSINYLGKYTAIANATQYILVMPAGTTIEDAKLAIAGRRQMYALAVEQQHNVTAHTFPTASNGHIVVGGLATSRVVHPVITYTLHYVTNVLARDGGLLRYQVTRESTGLVVTPTKVVAKTTSIAEATSLGFNMLSDNPYLFENTSGLTLRLQGILPYKTGNGRQLMLSANMGEPIRFVVIYDYRAGEKYRAQWEYAQYGSSEYRVISAYSNTLVQDGADITLTFTPEHDKFTLRCSVAPLKDNGEVDAALVKVVAYPVYTLNNAYLRDISESTYNLHNATGIYSYNTMLLLWGVSGAETTLFFSDLNDPSYFPFPNNIHVFQDEVLAVQAYLGSLLVFTKGGIFLMSGTVPILMTVQPLYQNMSFTKDDLHSIKVLKNYVFMQTSNSFYLLIPNTYTGSISDIKLVNITAPVKELIDDWYAFLKLVFTSLYGNELQWREHTKVEQYDYFNYVDESQVRNVYRFAILERDLRYQLDVVLIYDTDTNIWRTELINLPFTDVAVSGDTLVSLYLQRTGTTTELYAQELRYKNGLRKDGYNTCFYGTFYNDAIVSSKEAEMQLLPNTVTATVLRVIDGDTFETAEYGSVRLHYVDTPEYTSKVEPYGKEATDLLTHLLPADTVVTLEFEGNRTDKYSRVLAWVFKDGLLVQNAIAEAGYVKNVYLYNAYKYQAQLDLRIKNAFNAEIGMYDGSTPYPKTIKNYQTLAALPNYQILDSGNREQDIYFEKRYREIQFMFINNSAAVLQFFTKFFLDSVVREDYFTYKIVHDVDKNSPTYGTIYVDIDESANLEVFNETSLGTWELDTSMFPDIQVVKVIFRISGKGYSPRVLLISRNAESYNLLGFSWVYRMMNAR